MAWEQRLIPENYGLRVKRLPENNQRECSLNVEQVRELADQCSDQVKTARVGGAPDQARAEGEGLPKFGLKTSAPTPSAFRPAIRR